jgi:N-acetylglucosamine kinase-like BadF-type ATPase
MDLVLGIEGGGTQTTLMTATPQGRLNGRFGVAGTSLSRGTPAEVAATLGRGLSLMREMGPATIRAVCAGFASAASAANRSIYTGILKSLWPQATVKVVSDAELTLRAATHGQAGIVVIAGTGSIAWGQYRGRQERVGGLGPGQDAGSGDWIGRQAVAAGVVPAPADGNFAALLPRLVQHHFFEADAILRQAGRELALLAERCARLLEWEDPMVYVWGGVFHHIPEVRQYFQEASHRTPRRIQQAPPEAALDWARELLQHP